jgi:hypothetical protein
MCAQRSRGRLSAAPAAVLCAACSTTLPVPPGGPVPGSAFTAEVPYPPPAARVEVVPARQREGTLWIDGQWDWDGKAWAWVSGAWVEPPEGAYFTPWQVRREPDGRLRFARAAFRDRSGQALGAGHESCRP